MRSKNTVLLLIPIMFTFFTMGFVDLVGITTNYVKIDLNLSDTMANIFPSMVFFWFFIFSIPTGILMNRIGRRKTVISSLLITITALSIPIINYSFTSMLLSFSLLGIGNTLMQVSLNPLLSNIIVEERLASYMTFGQFIKAIASFLAPIIAAKCAFSFGDWKYLFPIFMSIAVLSTLLLSLTSIKEQKVTKGSTFAQSFALLKDKMILISFIGIMCHVGIDVGTNVTAPKIFIERLSMSIEEAGYATSIYFLLRTIGCLGGVYILARFSAKKIFITSVLFMLLGLGGLLFSSSPILISLCIGLIGLGNSNIFPIILSQVMVYMPERKNEVSGLMIMGLIGGAIFPLLMGLLSDALLSQIGALIVLIIGVLYLVYASTKLKDKIA